MLLYAVGGLVFFPCDAPDSEGGVCVGLQLIAAIPESRTLQRAGAAGTALPQDCPAAIAGHALAGRILGERIPLTCF